MGSVGSRIRECRKSLGLTQGKLGELVGVSDQSISDWEKDKALPLNSVVALAKVLKTSTDFLLTGKYSTFVNPADLKPTPEEILRKAYELKEPPKMHILPVVNKIAANHLPSFSEVKETIPVDIKFDAKRHYCLMVKGRSMHPTIMEGDIVVVKQVSYELDEYDPERGPAKLSEWVKLNKKVVCAQVNGEEPELKRIFVQDAAKRETGFIIYLRGDNPQSRMITIENETTLRIVGQVQQIVRDPNNFE